MQLLSFRNLSEPGGPGFTPAQVDVIAAEYKIKDTNEQGKMVERAGRPADHFPPPATKFPDRDAARSFGDRQGARLRARIPGLSCSTCSRSIRSTASTTSWRC